MILFFILSPFIGLLLLVFIIRAIVLAFSRGKKYSSGTDSKYLFSSKEDAVSQIYYFLAVLFFSLFLYNFNTSIGSPLNIEHIVLISTVATFALSYASRSIFLLPFGIIGVYMSVVLFISRWLTNGEASLFASIIIGMLIALVSYVIGRIHELYPKWERFGMSYVIISLFPIGAFLFYFSSYQGLGVLESVARLFIYDSTKVATLALFLVLLFVILGSYAIMKKKLRGFEVISGALIALIVLLISLLKFSTLFLTHASYYGSKDILTGNGILLIFLFNALLFIFISGFIVLGYFKRESWAINLGSGLFVLFFIVKYIQFLVDAVSKSLLFIVGGILLLLLGYAMSSGRKKLLNSIK